MQIGEVIREYRKKMDMTQEEMANRLGVTAPAVNKWENGKSQPDIMLLAPIARLLGITPDTLLSFQEELSSDEVNHLIRELEQRLKEAPFEDVFQWAKEKIEQYPNCESMIWQIAVLLDAWCLVKDIPEAEQYEGYINDCYECVLHSEDENIRSKAADSLYGFYLRKKQYERAEEYLRFLSNQNPERKRKQALIYSKMNRIEDAYKAYEELLLSGYQMTSMVFQSMFMLTMEKQDKEKARMLIEKQSKLANVFEMGEYSEQSCWLDLVTAERDVEATIDTMERMLGSVSQICNFRNSSLYEHMEFKEINEESVKELQQNLLNLFREKETYGYMEGNERWQKMIEG